MSSRFDPTVYLIVDPVQCEPRGWLPTVRFAVEGGVRMVQLRHDCTEDGLLQRQVSALRPLLRARDCKLIINNHVDIALRLEVDGVHLGQADASPAEARRRLGPNAIIGLSVTRAEEVETVDPSVVDYVGLGPVFATASKTDAAPPMGVDVFRALVARISVPVVAIGGVSIENAGLLRSAGADGLALISALCGAKDPRSAAESLVRAMRGASS